MAERLCDWEICGWAISKLQRLWWWLSTHLGLIAAIVAGGIITGVGIFAKADYAPVTMCLEEFGGTKLLDGVKEWAPHFGPELMVLAFAAIFVEGALNKRERRRAIRFRTVQSLVYLVSYALQCHLYFDGGSSNYLAMEKDAIKRRSEMRKRTLWFDERGLYDEAEKSAVDFIDDGRQFAWAVDRLDSQRARLRTDLLNQQVAHNFWPAMTALEENAKAAFRRVPPASQRPNKALDINDLLDEDRRTDWEDQIATLKNSNPSIRDRLDIYFMNYREIIKLRVALLNRFALFEKAALSFRDRVWESSNPDE